MSVTVSEKSNLVVIFTNQTVFVDETSAVIAHVLVKYNTLVASFFSTLSVTSLSYNYSLIVDWSYLTFKQPDYKFGQTSSYLVFPKGITCLAALTDVVFQ